MLRLLLLLCWLLGFSLPVLSAQEEASGPEELRRVAAAAFEQERWRDAFEAYRRLALDEQRDADSQELQRLWQSLRYLRAWEEMDPLVDALSQRFGPEHWPQRLILAELLVRGLEYERGRFRMPTQAQLIDGQWQRGQQQGGQGPRGSLRDHDRWRGLQLIESILPTLTQAEPSPALAPAYLRMAACWLDHPQGNWPLQLFSDLAEEPDPAYPQSAQGFSANAPVHADGSPRFYAAPEAWDQAETDLERVLWLWAQARHLGDAQVQRDADLAQASLAESWYGVRSLGSQPPLMLIPDEDAEAGLVDVRYLVQDLRDDETIARLASGVQRFDLPQDWNYISLWQQAGAHEELAQEFEHRRQFPRAAAAWEQAGRVDRQQQITQDHLLLGAASSVALGNDVRIPLVFRNAQQVELQAQRIDLAAVLVEVRAWRSKRRKSAQPWQSNALAGLGHRLMAAEEGQWVVESRSWSIDLQPAADHLPSHTHLHVQLDAAGPWLLSARAGSGAVSRSLVWVLDTVMLTQPIVDAEDRFGHLHLVVDARNGRPLPGMGIGGQGLLHYQPARGSRIFHVQDYAAQSNEQGFAWMYPPEGERSWGHRWSWLLWTSDGQRLAIQDPQIMPGFFRRSLRSDFSRRSVNICDRPIYRPGDRVQGKRWEGMISPVPGRSQPSNGRIGFSIRDPAGERVAEQIIELDAWGGATWEWQIPKDARLGVYQVGFGNDALRFRVEDYRSPEFSIRVEVPEEPLVLGEQAQVQVQASYVWGGPVRGAELRYRIKRRYHDSRWIPEHPWDWLYGAAFWRHSLLPLWLQQSRYQARSPFDWFPRSIPEHRVSSGVLRLDEAGQASIPIDTAEALMQHGDSDHRYRIEVEVTDASRRSEEAVGYFVAAREAFTIRVWTWEGFQRVGDQGRWQIRARSANGRPLPASGQAKLYQRSFDQQGLLSEVLLERWELHCDAEGAAEVPLQWQQPGQYRLQVSLQHAGAEVSTSQNVNILGAEDDALPRGSFKSAALELHLAQTTLRPGEEAEILLTSSRPDAHVMLFERVKGEMVFGPPQWLQLRHGSALHRLPISQEDAPNIFVHAIAVIDGRVHSQVLNIPVPPAERMLEVTLEANPSQLQPGERTDITLSVRDETGQPRRATAVIAVTDSALDMLAGELRPPALRQAFWSQHRQYRTHFRHSLPRGYSALLRAGEVYTRVPGIFGSWTPQPPTALRLALQPEAGQLRPVLQQLAGLSEVFDPHTAAHFPSALQSQNPAFMAIGAGGGAAGAYGNRVGQVDAALLQAQAMQPLPEPTLRHTFADTALWVGELEVDESGQATLPLDLPDNLTTWSLRAWVVADDWRVGEAQAEIVASKEVLLRLHAPRFVTEGDVFQLEASLHNDLDQPLQAEVELRLEAAEASQAQLDLSSASSREVLIPARGELRVHWDLRAISAGPVLLRASLRSPQGGDAVEQRLPIHAYGAETTQARALVLAPDQPAGSMTLKVPEAHIPEASELILRWSPSPAAAVVEAIPYLLDSPYGSTETTLNRFVPAVLALQLLEASGVDLAALREAQSSLNPAQLADPAQRWQHPRRNPVFDPAEVGVLVRRGLERLGHMQLGDGGWGWFSGNLEHSTPHTTAVVLRGLLIARDAGIEVDDHLISRGLAWLARHRDQRIAAIQDSIAVVEQEARSQRQRTRNIDAYVESVLSQAGQPSKRIRGWLIEDRSALSAYAQALLGLACLASEDADGLQIILEHLAQFVERREDNHTAWLRVESPWWRWYGAEYEANSAYLLLLVRAQADADTRARLARHLLASRRGNRWQSTRDTAWAVEALSAHLRDSDELHPEQQVRIFHGQRLLKEERITAENLFTRSGSLSIPSSDLGPGAHELRIERRGAGYLHANAWLRVMSRQDPIPAQGLEVSVQRRWWRISKVVADDERRGADGQPVAGTQGREQRQALDADAVIRPGEVIEVELIVESANDYEYILIEDRRFAGAEPVERNSGYRQGAYMAFHADRVALFVTNLPRGRQTYRYRFRAELPGTLQAMPARITGIYAPELTGNSSSRQAKVADEE